MSKQSKKLSYIREDGPDEVCVYDPMHRTQYTDRKTGERVCTTCMTYHSNRLGYDSQGTIDPSDPSLIDHVDHSRPASEGTPGVSETKPQRELEKKELEKGSQGTIEEAPSEEEAPDFDPVETTESVVGIDPTSEPSPEEPVAKTSSK